MDAATTARKINEEVNNLLWTISDSELAVRIEELARDTNAIDLFSYNCLHFGRQYNAAFFVMSASLWHGFVLDDWVTLLKNISPRPEPVWGWDGGQFCDVAFLVNYIKVDAFEIAQSIAKLETSELRKVIQYGAIHLELLLCDESTISEKGDSPDPYESILAKSVTDVRSQILRQVPSLDIAGVSQVELRERLVHGLIANQAK